jgi:hypothetical protein
MAYVKMEQDLQSLFRLYVYSCTHWLRPRKSPSPAFGLLSEVAIGQLRYTSLCDPLIDSLFVILTVLVFDDPLQKRPCCII